MSFDGRMCKTPWCSSMSKGHDGMAGIIRHTAEGIYGTQVTIMGKRQKHFLFHLRMFDPHSWLSSRALACPTSFFRRTT